MTNTPELIDSLVHSAAPVRRLRPPLVRAGLWIMLAALVLVLMQSVMASDRISLSDCGNRCLS